MIQPPIVGLLWMIGIQMTWFGHVVDTFLTSVDFTAESPCTRQRTQCKDKSDRPGPVTSGLKQEYNQFTDIIYIISIYSLRLDVGSWPLKAAETCSWPTPDREWFCKGNLAHRRFGNWVHVATELSSRRCRQSRPVGTPRWDILRSVPEDANSPKAQQSKGTFVRSIEGQGGWTIDSRWFQNMVRSKYICT